MYSDITSSDYVGITCFACSLTLNAGFVNTLCISIVGSGGADSGAVAHMTGHVSRGLAVSLGTGDGDMLWRSLLLLVAFAFGCALASAFFPDQNLVLERRYAWLYMHTAGILIFGLVVDAIFDDDFVFLFFCCMSMGYQNSFGTCCCHSFAHRPSDFSLRTTHLTGLITDMGIIVGRVIFHKDYSRVPVLKMYGSMIVFYLLGGTVAYAGHVSLGKKAVAFNIILICASSAVYMIMVRKGKRDKLLGLKTLVVSKKKRQSSNNGDGDGDGLDKGSGGGNRQDGTGQAGKDKSGEIGKSRSATTMMMTTTTTRRTKEEELREEDMAGMARKKSMV